MKRILALIAVLCLLTGCTAPQVSDPTVGGVVNDPSIPQTVPGEEKGELRLPYNRDGSFQPFTSGDVNNRCLLPLIYQGLFTYDREYEVTPILCKSYQVSTDMRTYTFYLEKATFSDGQQVTALDVEASLRAAKNQGFYAGRFQHVKTIDATSDGSVVIKLDTPCENLPILLDVPIVKASQVNDPVPLGTGPYLLEDTGDGKRLRRQPVWWCDAELAVEAQIIPLYHGTTQRELWDLYKFSGLSMVCTDAYVDFRGDYELWESENGMFLYLSCNMKSNVFSKKAIRSALTHAIDRETLVNKQFRGFAHSATLPASPEFPYYSETLAEKYGYKLEKFAQAVTEAQLEDNNVILLVNRDDPLRTHTALAIAEMLEAGGLAVTIPEVSGQDYINALKWEQYDLYLGQTKLSPNMDLTAFFAEDGDLNFGRISNVASNALCKEALANSGNYQSLHKQVMEDGRICPILFRSYAIYGRRGMFSLLSPSRDNIFFYTLGKTMETIRITEEIQE
ncbi:MAG: ABC transporter substrate-binding protein [Ruminococcaceae bacterium]|nr:ABC transporter substrate-binding protein [Oscillospiraceae bacterium]